MRSRVETGTLLRSTGIPVIEFRVSIVIGSGSTSFEMICALVEKLRLVVAVCSHNRILPLNQRVGCSFPPRRRHAMLQGSVGAAVKDGPRARRVTEPSAPVDRAPVTIPRQSRGPSFVSRSKRLVGVAGAAPWFSTTSKVAHQ